MNKRGETEAGDMIQIISFIFNLAAIFVGIYAMIYMFYGSEYEFRQVDSDILLSKIKSCVIENEFNFENEFFRNEFLERCRVNEKTLNESFLIILDKKEGNEKNRILKLGSGDSVQCGLSSKSEEYLKCSNFTLMKEVKGEIVEIFIQTGSNQRSKEEVA